MPRSDHHPGRRRPHRGQKHLPVREEGTLDRHDHCRTHLPVRHRRGHPRPHPHLRPARRQRRAPRHRDLPQHPLGQIPRDRLGSPPHRPRPRSPLGHRRHRQLRGPARGHRRTGPATASPKPPGSRPTPQLVAEPASQTRWTRERSPQPPSRSKRTNCASPARTRGSVLRCGSWSPRGSR